MTAQEDRLDDTRKFEVGHANKKAPLNYCDRAITFAIVFSVYAMTTFVFDNAAAILVALPSSEQRMVALVSFGPILALGIHGRFTVFLAGLIAAPLIASLIRRTQWQWIYIFVAIIIWLVVGYLLFRENYMYGT